MGERDERPRWPAGEGGAAAAGVRPDRRRPWLAVRVLWQAESPRPVQALVDEEQRLRTALEQLRTSIDNMLRQQVGPLVGESRDILETYRMLAHDPSWASRLFDAVASGLSAEAAVDWARREHRARLQNATDHYLRDRLHDLEDLDNRLLRLLAGHDHVSSATHLDGAILIARRLGPADLLEYQNAMC